MPEKLLSGVYLIGTTGATLDGKLVNTDDNGNRVAGMIIGSKKIIIVTEANKIVKDVDTANRGTRLLPG